MSTNSWSARARRPASRLAVIALTGAALLLSGCGLFGGDEETPAIVEPPQSTAQTEQSDSPVAVVSAAQQEQQEQPVQPVRVTTSPDEQSQQQTEPQAAAPSQDEPDPTIYVVQAGDTLAAIANRLGVRLDDLISLNGIQNPDQIQVGQQLQIPQPEPAAAVEGTPSESAAADQQEADPPADQAAQEDEQPEPPAVQLPTVAVPAATPTQVSYSQFPQPGPEQTTDTIPDPPSNFLQYGAAALPWLHGMVEVEPIIELFKAWPMPALAVGNDRVMVIDTSGTGVSALSIVFTDPNSFGAEVPYSNLVVFDPVPGDASRYRIGYDHAQAYGREVQGIQQISDWDLTGDDVRDLTFRELTCDASGCVSSFYILTAAGDGYRVITSAAARVAQVSAITLEDRTGDSGLELVVQGLATDEAEPTEYTFVFAARGNELIEAHRISESGESTTESAPAEEVEESEPADEESDELSE